MFVLLAQATSLPKSGVPNASDAYGFIFDLLKDPIVLTVLGIVVLFLGLLVGLAILKAFYKRGRSLPKEFEKQVLMILVPKESLQQEEKGNEGSQQGIREQIAVAETFFSGIGGLRPAKGFKTWLWGREDHVAFEIVVHNQQIIFYVAAPHYLLTFVEQQIQAQYPEAQIEKVEDYNIFHPQGFALAANLVFGREPYFPVKTYQEIESDPLNALTSALSTIPQGDGAAIQFVVRPAPPAWHGWGRKIASTMRQGKSLADAKRAVSGGLLSNTLHGLVKSKGDQQNPQLYQMSPLEEEMIKRLETKSSKAGMEANIRVVVSSANEASARAYLDNITGAFAQFNIYEYGNSFSTQQPRNQIRLIEDYIFRNFQQKQILILNTEEMASLYHFPLPQTETSNIKWLDAKRAPAPLGIPTEGIILGFNEYRGKKTDIRILRADRQRHMYVIGKSGAGKSTLLANYARQDIANGEGVCVIDPHGDLVDDILEAIPKERAEDVIVFDPGDIQHPLGLNLLEFDPNYPEQKTFVINEMIKIFDKLYDLKSTGGPMFEQYMRNAMLLIMDDPESGSTLMEISKVLADEEFRKFKLTKCKNPVVIDFWVNEAEKAGGEAALANMVPYITSKLTQFVSNDVMRPIIGQQQSAFNFREIMDQQKILLVRLSKGKIGELNAHLLGMVIVGKILMSALSRTDMAQADRKDFYLYIDEFQNFTTDSIAIILSEARKYRLDLIIAHQYLGQLVKNGDTQIKDAVFGNVGTIISSKIGPEDAEVFAKEFAPVFNAYDLLNVEQYSSYIKLLVNNQSMRPFSMKGYPLQKFDSKQLVDTIKDLSRLKYGKPREEVEQSILQRTKMTRSTTSPTKKKEEDPFAEVFDEL